MAVLADAPDRCCLGVSHTQRRVGRVCQRSDRVRDSPTSVFIHSPTPTPTCAPVSQLPLFRLAVGSEQLLLLRLHLSATLQPEGLVCFEACGSQTLKFIYLIDSMCKHLA